MIHLENVTKEYQTRSGIVHALKDVSLDVGPGEFVAVRGHSGSGKSTLLALVGALAHPTSGQITVCGHELNPMGPAERARFRAENIGFVFQMFHLLPYLTVLENVLVAAPRSERDRARNHARELLDQFGLNERLFHRPGQLSAGERQRVAMARALLNQPPLLLADEPTGNLDDDNAQALLDLLAKYHQDGGTILLVTHHANAAERAERTIYLKQGQLLQSETVGLQV